MFKFKCKNCGAVGPAACTIGLPFVHCTWYYDEKGTMHGCLYCRKCGKVHDTVGSLFCLIEMLLGKIPSKVKVVVSYDNVTFKKLLRISTPYFQTFPTLPYLVLKAMEEDGRLEDEGWPEDDHEMEEYLKDCLQDKNKWVRRAAQEALECSRRNNIY